MMSLGNIRTRLIQLFLAATLALPAGAGVMNALPARADCYYNGYFWHYGHYSGYPLPSGSTYSDAIQYTLGYSCSGVPTSVDISYFASYLSFSGGPTHYSFLAGVCKDFDRRNWNCNSWVWETNSTAGACSGNCTVVRNAWPGRWMAYYSTAAVTNSYLGCTSYNGGGGAKCDVVDELFLNRVDVAWSP
jgi:hypothetical protein